MTVMSSTTDIHGDSLFIYNVTVPNMGNVHVVSASAGTFNYTIPTLPVLVNATFTYYIADSAYVIQTADIVTIAITDNDMPQAQNYTQKIHWRTFNASQCEMRVKIFER